MAEYLFTSESVTEGHPDKICDIISDSILDELLKQDPDSRVACETICTTGQVIIMGEISTKADVDYEAVARKAIREIGYTNEAAGLDADTCNIMVKLDEQSPDIALGVDKSFEAKSNDSDDGNANGAGDQGMMFGYACNETEELMPLPISLAHKLAKRLADVRKDGTLPYLNPDGKTQVTVKYEDGKPTGIKAIVVSCQHTAETDLQILRRDIIENVIKPTIPQGLMNNDTTIFVNPTGRFVIGGPQGDSGLTGRKIMVDTYGAYSRHGGGAFSGKDPTKVDRSAAYAARWIAKNIVAANLAEKCEIQIAYAIGVAEPVSVMVNTFGTGTLPDEKICKIVNEVFDLRPTVIINTLDLKRPIYKNIAAYGHMGRTDLDLPWEKTNKIEAIETAAEKICY